MSKGNAVPHPTMQPCMRKVTRISSPMPEVAEIEALPPPITVPSQVVHAPLFEEPVGMGDDHVGKEPPVSSGK